MEDTWENRHDRKFAVTEEQAKELSNDYLVALIDDHSKQLIAIAKILDTLTKEIKENRNIVIKSSEVTAAIVETLNIMDDNGR